MAVESILTVTVPATSYDLTDLDTVKEELSINTLDDDGMLRRWISEESARIAAYCGRVFPVETVSETFRIISVRGEYWIEGINLGRDPVTAVTSVTEDDSAPLSTGDYEADLNSGILYRLWNGYRSTWRAWQKVVVVYAAGYAAIPSDVSASCITLMKHRWAARTRDPSLRAIDIQGIGSKQFWVGSTGDVGDMPPEVSAALDRNYVVRV